MPFSWPTLAQAIYRISRLRRLIVAAIVMSGLLLTVISVIDPAILPPMQALRILAIVGFVATTHVVLFPNVPVETLSLAVSTTCFVVVLPLLEVLSDIAPIPYRGAALVLLIFLAVLLIVVLTLITHFLIETLVYVGPSVHMRLTTDIHVPFAPSVASRQFGLRPDTRRGRVMAGPVDDKGFFDVAVVSQHEADPDDPTRPMVVKIDAKVLQSDPENHEVMLVLAGGDVTVTSYKYIPEGDGCRVEITEMPGDFTLGMHAMFWLMDQQTDNLVEVAELMQSTPSCANGLAHAVSLLSLAGIILHPRQPALDKF